MEVVSREANGNSFLSADTGQLALHATNATVSQQALGRRPFHETERVWSSCSRYEVLRSDCLGLVDQRVAAWDLHATMNRFKFFGLLPSPIPLRHNLWRKPRPLKIFLVFT